MAKSAMEGKTALVTGASKGIGRSIALRLAEGGAKVAVNYNSSAEAASEVANSIIEAGGEAMAIHADISNLDQVTAMIEHVGEHMFRRVRDDGKLAEATTFEIGPDGEVTRIVRNTNYSIRVR